MESGLGFIRNQIKFSPLGSNLNNYFSDPDLGFLEDRIRFRIEIKKNNTDFQKIYRFDEEKTIPRFFLKNKGSLK